MEQWQLAWLITKRSEVRFLFPLEFAVTPSRLWPHNFMNETEIKRWVGSCLRKKVYKTKEFAEKMVLLVAKHTGKDMDIYNCQHCAGYHLTTKK